MTKEATLAAARKEFASSGGKALAALRRAGKVPLSGFAVPVPTVCPRCGEEQPTHSAARKHCRNLDKSA